ncbi:hypothetical protein [Synechococcus sp. PCC 7336]|uniref:hypothetical protein n=1 Tax=Synechococcus sp. PCC 7336 TaxID=195250 RepID=UPI0004779A89|nr:hypothetical protein [Synechococcus sp. PCC 7336]
MTVSSEARRLIMLNRTRLKQRQQSLLTRSAAHVGISADRVDYWGHIQGKVQPTFRTNYERSHATMS